MKNKLLGLCSELRLQDSVHFLGHCSSSEVKAAISRCHAVVLPSRVSENSGLILLEGGSQGRPGIGSHLGGTPELLSPPARGWTFNSEDSNSLAQVFDELAKNPQEIARRGTEFRTWIRSEFDPEAHWNKLEEVYLELVS
jgi:glycosyltransferase involved in cell wall biosynthesis